MVLLCFIFDNPLPVRILAGSYNGMYFQGSHFMTRKVGSFFPGGWWHHAYLGFNVNFFKFQSQYTAHMQVKPVITGKCVGSYFAYATLTTGTLTGHNWFYLHDCLY